ncbi:MAG: FadR/GntR family transcriptional regulator [Vulcanimicrobiaceae bacterium]
MPVKIPQKLKKSHQLVELLLARFNSAGQTAEVRLPSERAIALEYGVSRTAVREALAALQLAGYIDTRVGEGSFVVMSPPEPSKHLSRGLLTGMSIVERLEARGALELACAFLAVRKATKSDLARINATIRLLRQRAASQDYEAYLAATLEFHTEIARAAHSSILFALAKDLLERHRQDQWLLHERYTSDAVEYSLRIHAALAQAIQNKDLLGIFSAVTAHYEDYPVLHSADEHPEPSARAAIAVGQASPDDSET